MKTLLLEAVVDEDGMLRIETPCGLPPGPIEVVLVLQPMTSEEVVFPPHAPHVVLPPDTDLEQDLRRTPEAPPP